MYSLLNHMVTVFKSSAFATMLFVLATCQPGEKTTYETAEFKDFWYTGKAEVSTYRLSQSRYGENREGKAILIFVTEDLSEKDHVKLDHPEHASDDKVSVLKLNFIKKFNTGLYDYNMMQSVFTPVPLHSYASSLKTTVSVQEWCGQVFTQLNLKGSRYRGRSYSYFRQDGDKEIDVALALLEDEIWNRIRLNPSSLPLGETEFIPSLFITALLHQPVKVIPANAVLTEADSLLNYTIQYLESGRKITISFGRSFPHQITGWREEYREGQEIQVTTAKLDKTLHIDYWTKNKREFEHLRDSLGL